MIGIGNVTTHQMPDHRGHISGQMAGVFQRGGGMSAFGFDSHVSRKHASAAQIRKYLKNNMDKK